MKFGLFFLALVCCSHVFAAADVVEGPDTLAFPPGVGHSYIDSVLSHRSDIRHLDLFCHGLDSVPLGVKRQRKLASLNIGCNNIQALPDWVGDIDSLLEINLSYSQDLNFEQAFGVLKRCRNLRRLVLRGNKLKEIPVAISWLHGLEEIDFSNNELVELPKTLVALGTLRTITLESDTTLDLDAVIAILSKLPKLESLSLYSSKISDLPASIGLLSFLHTLNLNNNALRELPIEICSLSNLQYLGVAKNELHTLPQGIEALTRLEVLVLVGNPLAEEYVLSIRKTLSNCKILF